MKVNKASARQKVSFGHLYYVKGSNESLDEVCWYLRKKLAKKDSFGMDFLDIRLNSQPKSTSQSIFSPQETSIKSNSDAKNTYIISPTGRIKRHTETDLDTEESSFKLAERLKEEWNRRKKFTTPTDVDATDLIVTGADKDPTEKALNRYIAEESAKTKLGNHSGAEELRQVGDDFFEMQKRISLGKPITNLRQNIVRLFLPLQFLEIPTFEATKILEHIQKGNFDPHKGLNLQG